MNFDNTGRRKIVPPPLKVLINEKFKNSRGKALEVACGSGRTASYLHEEGFSVDAFDISRDSIEFGKANYSNEINFFLMDVKDMSSLAKNYDLIFDWGILDLYGPSREEKQVYFKDVFNLLKSGGIFTFYCFNNKSFGISKTGDRIRVTPKGRTIYFTPLEELITLLEKDFKILESKLIVIEKYGTLPLLGNWIVVRKE